jgi:hypothetical protein
MSTPELFAQSRGPMSGRNIIGEVTESVQKFIIDGWDQDERPPVLKEELDYIPMDRNEKVVYVYMYRLAANESLKNQKRFRQAPVFMNEGEGSENTYFHRPPVLVDLFYLIMVHSKFRSDAERLLGWTMLRLNEATHLVYRPRRFLLPDGRQVDSLGRNYHSDLTIEDDNLVMEKVSMALVDDLTVGDAINMFSLHEAPYRPFLTYRARIALDGPLVHMPSGTTINMPRLERNKESASVAPPVRRNGRMTRSKTPTPMKTNPGPTPHNLKRDFDPQDEE